MMAKKKYGFWALFRRKDKLDALLRLQETHKETLGKLSVAQGAIAEKEEIIAEMEDVIHIYQTVDIPALEIKVVKARGQAQYYRGLWEDALHIPDIKTLVEEPTLYSPWNDEDVNRPLAYSGISDNTYYVYSKETWIKILALIHKEVKDEVPRWIREVSDCDNFAKIMIATVQLAFIEAGEKREAAFGYALGRDGASFHAYNFFRTSDGKFYLYEPQDGSIVCELGEGEGVYQTYAISL